MKKMFAMALVCAATAFSAVAQDKIDASAKLKQEAQRAHGLRQELAYLIAPIKTAADLDEYLNTTNMHTSPLKKLSDAGRERFLSSLTFNEKGLTGFRYEDLQAELSYTQIYQVLALFGAQHATPMMKSAKKNTSLDGTISTMDYFYPDYADYEDYQCAKRATCSRSYGNICMSGC